MTAPSPRIPVPYSLRDTRSDAVASTVLRARDPRDIEAYLVAAGPGRVVELALDVRTVDDQTVTIAGDKLLALLADPLAEPAE